MSKLSLIHSTQKAGPNTEIYGPRSEYGFLRTARRPIRMQDSSKPYNKVFYSLFLKFPQRSEAILDYSRCQTPSNLKEVTLSMISLPRVSKGEGSISFLKHIHISLVFLVLSCILFDTAQSFTASRDS